MFKDCRLKVLQKFAAVLLVGACASQAAGKIRYALKAGDLDINVHLPRDYDSEKKYPLVITLHGWLSPMAVHNSFLPFRKYVDEKQFILVEPHNGATFSTGMNFNRPVAIVDAVKKKLRSLQDVNRRRLHAKSIDWKRFYLAGHSAGARGAYIYAAARDDLAGLVILAGDGSGADLSGVTEVFDTPKSPTALFHIHGTRDITVPYRGGVEQFESYLLHNGCSEDPYESKQSKVTKLVGQNCIMPTSFYSVEGDGHHIFTDRLKIFSPIVDALFKVSR